VLDRGKDLLTRHFSSTEASAAACDLLRQTLQSLTSWGVMTPCRMRPCRSVGEGPRCRGGWGCGQVVTQVLGWQGVREPGQGAHGQHDRLTRAAVAGDQLTAALRARSRASSPDPGQRGRGAVRGQLVGAAEEQLAQQACSSLTLGAGCRVR
jgi:hypothetical protein